MTREGKTLISSLADDISAALNRHSAENESNTPDFVLAKFLLGCLQAWDNGTRERERWYGRSPNDGPFGAAPPSAWQLIATCATCEHSDIHGFCEQLRFYIRPELQPFGCTLHEPLVSARPRDEEL